MHTELSFLIKLLITYPKRSSSALRSFKGKNRGKITPYKIQITGQQSKDKEEMYTALEIGN